MKAEYEIIHNGNSQTITVPYGKEIWVNGILLSAGTYRYESKKANSLKTEEQWKEFVEWIGSHGPYWFYDLEKKYWIGTPAELPTTERLWEIWINNVYPNLP